MPWPYNDLLSPGGLQQSAPTNSLATYPDTLPGGLPNPDATAGYGMAYNAVQDWRQRWRNALLMPEGNPYIRRLGLGVRDVAEGVIGAPYDATAWALRQAGVPVNSLGENLTALGLPQPETSGERLTSAVAQPIAATLTGQGVGRAMMGAASPVVAGVGRALASNPAMQAVAAGTGGAVQEETGSPLLGLATSLGVVGGAHLFAGGVPPVRVTAVEPSRAPLLAAATREGMGTVAPPMAQPMENELMQGIRAYHGSPHDFDAFSSDMIGTGEGAQAQGHGLYFAGREATGRWYRDRLAGANFEGQPISELNAPPRAQEALQWVATGEGGIGSVAEAADRLRQIGQNAAQRAESSSDRTRLQLLAKDYGDAADWLNANAGGRVQSQGKMYEVNLNIQPHEMLDWDKPLSEQHPSVQKALAGHLQGVPPDKAAEMTGYDLYQHVGRWASDNPGAFEGTRGYTEALGPLTVERLQQQGIKGVTYLDQGSRSAGEGTSNYVVFNPQLIEILRKYGLAGLGLGTAAQVATQPQQ